jgi:hypothetical protein
MYCRLFGELYFISNVTGGTVTAFLSRYAALVFFHESTATD